MYCRVIACDFDGTGATNDRPAPEIYAALAAARSHAIVTLLVTGRVLEEAQSVRTLPLRCDFLSSGSFQISRS